MQVHVLSVPGKAGLPAPKVQVGRVHSADLNPVVLQKHTAINGSFEKVRYLVEFICAYLEFWKEFNWWALRNGTGTVPKEENLEI